MSEAEKFPFGIPCNRPQPKAELAPVPGRPGWWRDRAGVERYIEPPRPGAVI